MFVQLQGLLKYKLRTLGRGKKSILEANETEIPS